VIQEQSVKTVVRWLIQCNEAVQMDGGTHSDNDNNSVVSFVDGEVREQPDMDVKLWSRVKSISRKERWSKPNSTVGEDRRQSSKRGTYVTNLSDCVYDRPGNYPDEYLVKAVNKIFGEEGKVKFFNNLSSKIYLNMGQRLSKRRNVPIDDAIKIIKAKEQYSDPKFMMSGGRSEGELANSARDTMVASDMSVAD
jgi:hypothetical protein